MVFVQKIKKNNGKISLNFNNKVNFKDFFIPKDFVLSLGWGGEGGNVNI